MISPLDRLQYAAVLLADRSDWMRLGDRFSGQNAGRQSSNALSMLAVAAALVAVLLALGWVANWQESRRGYRSPRGLFRDLCQAHRLGWGSRRLLRRLARSVGLSQPAEVFLRPELFVPNRLPTPLAGQTAEIGRLARRLFGAELMEGLGLRAPVTARPPRK